MQDESGSEAEEEEEDVEQEEEDEDDLEARANARLDAMEEGAALQSKNQDRAVLLRIGQTGPRISHGSYYPFHK